MYGKQSSISNTQHNVNVMQPTSTHHGYPAGATPYGYGVPTPVRPPGLPTSHWRAVGYATQANWVPPQGQASVAGSHRNTPDSSDLLNHSGVQQQHTPVTSNTVHYHGDQLPATSVPFNSTVLVSPGHQVRQTWSSNSLTGLPGPLVQTSHAVSSTALNSALQGIKQEPKNEDEDFTDPNLLRRRVLEYYMDAMESLRVDYRDMLQELFFLQNGGNLVDYHGWRKRPNPQLLTFLNASRLDNEMSVSTPTATNTVSPSIHAQAVFSGQSHPSHVYGNNHNMNSEQIEHRQTFSHQTKPVLSTCTSVYSPSYGFTPHSIMASSNFSSMNSQSGLNASTHSSNLQHEKQEGHLTKTSDYKDSLTAKSFASASSSSSTFGSSSLSSMYGPALGTQEDIALQARKEQDTLTRISDLKRKGLWSVSRLPKVHEPPRKKAHWDYLLEEMQWLATDFSQERRWKRNMARKVGRSSFLSLFI